MEQWLRIGHTASAHTNDRNKVSCAAIIFWNAPARTKPNFSTFTLNRLTMNAMMNIFPRLTHNHKLAHALIRLFLGLVLFIRGVFLLVNPEALTKVIDDNSLNMWFSWITISHIVGGAMVAAGLLTRLGALIQLPILLYAVFFIHVREGLMVGGQSFELASLTMFLLLIFFFFGSGPYSLDHYFEQRKQNSSSVA